MRAQRIDITEDDYHADKLPAWCTGPSLSNSMAKILLDKSPAHAYAAHPKLGGAGRVLPASTLQTFDAGKLAHKLLLGKGAEVVVIDGEDWRSKDAREARDEAREAGKIPALRGVYDTAVTAADIVRSKLTAMGIDLDGQSEVQLVWQENPSDPIWCRGMLDHLRIDDGRATIYDLKTTRDAKPMSASHSIVRYGYDTQRAAYSRAVESLLGIGCRAIDFVFIFAETVPPFAVTAGRLDDVLVARGEERWNQANDLWARCLRADHWPEYASTLVQFEAPPWMSGDIEIGFEEE